MNLTDRKTYFNQTSHKNLERLIKYVLQEERGCQNNMIDDNKPLVLTYYVPDIDFVNNFI